MAFLIISLLLSLYICNFSIDWVFLIFYSNIILNYIFYILLAFTLFQKNSSYNSNILYKFEFLFNILLFNFLFVSNIFFKILKNLYCYGIKWKPLFKKTSYFGLYRTNKHQWLNK